MVVVGVGEMELVRDGIHFWYHNHVIFCLRPNKKLRVST